MTINFRTACSALFPLMLISSAGAAMSPVSVGSYGVAPNSGADATPGVMRALAAAMRVPGGTLVFPAGTYDFWPAKAAQMKYFISNHDPVDTRSVVMVIDHARGLTIDGQGSKFIFHEEVMPIAVTSSRDVTIRNFSLDYASPHFLVTRVLSADAASVRVSVDAGQRFEIDGGHVMLLDGSRKVPMNTSLELDPEKMAVAINVQDNFKFSDARVTAEGADGLKIEGLKNAPKVGNILIIRGVDRTDPAIWASESKDVTVAHVTVHAALGMAFIAQKSENLHLDGFNVTLAPGRYLTTNADATHFSNCKGTVVVENGKYENMLDDGINVHGSFLHVMKKVSANAMLLEWGHFQTFGFTFAAPGEHLEFADQRTMLPYGHAKVAHVAVPDDHHVLVTLDGPLPESLRVGDFVDNEDWRPSVVYRNNSVRRIRSRGGLFSTTAGVLIEGNHFEQMSEAAVLIPGEARDWFESTPSRNVVIRHNVFLDTNLAKPLTTGTIHIGPTIDTPAQTDSYNHRNILIEDNEFTLLGREMVQALSVDGLTFRNNRLTESTDYPRVDGGVDFSLAHSRCIAIAKNVTPEPLKPTDMQMQDTHLVSLDGAMISGTRAKFDTTCKAVVK